MKTIPKFQVPTKEIKRTIYKETWQVAALIAIMMQRSGQTRMRLSDKGLRALSGRTRLEWSVRERIKLDTLEYGYLIHHLDGSAGVSGNVVISLSALASAKPIKRTEVFTDDEWKSISNGTFDFNIQDDDLSSYEDDYE
ncbi:hypothetical protein NR402_09145 [Acidithiobacillus ferrooxidans]|uniref:hypothetical protein n=1 Tax=Acidithiobacillus ferrooxidans TaxID=920 RepID=UPI0013D3AFFC|nr:hypothetical protein [Acidithiobacillus ferrooxidans]MCR2830444.1 hypothetical protein [Acidithiobacillus ferrooxidans]